MSNENSTNVSDAQAMNALKQHGEKIIWVIIITLLAYFGWQYYQNNYAKIDTVAADMYTDIAERDDALNLGLQNPDIDDAIKAELAKEQAGLLADIDKLVATHTDTAYAWQALMIKARHLVDDANYKEAVTTLKQAQSINLEDEGLLAITQLRLGRTLLADQALDEALTVANKTLPEAFEASRQELLGDIYVAKKDVPNAKSAYQLAWDSLKPRAEGRSLLSLKMQSLGMNPEPMTPKPPVVDAPQSMEASPQTASELTESVTDGIEQASAGQDDGNATKAAQ